MEKNKERKNWFSLKWGGAHSFWGRSKEEKSLKKRVEVSGKGREIWREKRAKKRVALVTLNCEPSFSFTVSVDVHIYLALKFVKSILYS